MLFFNSMNAQQQNAPILEPGDTTFQAIYDKMVAYYDSQSSGGGLEEGSSENQFYRWAHFWRPRLDENGGFSGGNKAIAEFINSGMNLCDSEEDDNIDWRNLGPFNSDGARIGYPNCSPPAGEPNGQSQNQGWVNAISVHPLDQNEILVGGVNGGIWKSNFEGGVWNWTNTTDDEGFSIAGASRIIRHPRNPDIVYASTSSAFGVWSFGHSFGLGIIKSIDGGDTWTTTGFSPAYGFDGNVTAMEIHPGSNHLGTTTIYLGVPNKVIKYEETPTSSSSTVLFDEDDPTPAQGGPNIITDIEIENDGTVWFCYRKGVFKFITIDGVEIAVEEPLVVPPAAIAPPMNDNFCPDIIPNPYHKIYMMDLNRTGDLVVLIKYFIVTDCDPNNNGDGATTKERLNFLYRKLANQITWTMQDFVGDPWQNTFVLSPDDSDVIFFERDFGGTFRCMQ